MSAFGEWLVYNLIFCGDWDVFAALKEKIFGGNGASNVKAKNRLHFVLVQDRAGLTPEEMKSFKRELLEVFENYFVVDAKAFDIDYRREGQSTTLLINSPVSVKRLSQKIVSKRKAANASDADVQSDSEKQDSAEVQPA
jgi:cell division topological specificity factor MinE